MMLVCYSHDECNRLLIDVNQGYEHKINYYHYLQESLAFYLGNQVFTVGVLVIQCYDFPIFTVDVAHSQ